jgi:hypothetical protein
VRRWSIFWAIVLIVVGALLLLDNLGLLASNYWSLLGPSLLVALGLWILLSKPMRADAVEDESLTVPLQGATRAEVSLRHGAGRLNVTSGAAAGDLLTGAFEGGVGYRTLKDGATIRCNLRGGSDYLPLPRLTGSLRDGQNWSIALNADISIALNCKTGASESSFDLNGLKVSDFDLRYAAGDVRLSLPDAAGHTRVGIRGGMGTIRIHVPDNVAARISLSTGMSEVSIDDTRFPMRQGAYESPDFAGAEHRVDIHVRSGMSTVEIR